MASAPPLRAQNDLDRLLVQAAACESGQSQDPFRQLDDLVRQSLAEPAMRRELETALIKLLAPTATFEAQRFACKQLGVIGGNQALAPLGELLAQEQTAGIACLALTSYPPGKADELLRKALSSASGSARLQIINTLGDRRDAKSVPLLIAAAGGGDQPVAEAAVAALSKIGDSAARKALAALVKNTPPGLEAAVTEASIRCADALANAGDRKEAVAAYTELMAGSQPVFVRRSALGALIRLDKDDGQARILEVLHGTDSVLKPVAIAAVRTLPGKGVSEKFAADLPLLTPEEQVWLIESLGARGDAAARQAVGGSLASPDPAVRRAAAGALAGIGDRTSVPLLARALASATEADERRGLETALVGLPSKPDTEEAVLRELESATGTARASLVEVIARRQGSGANPALLAETAQSDPVVAKAAWRALGRTALADDVPAVLNSLLKVRDAAVLTEAENAATQAIGRIPEPGRRSANVRDALGRADTVPNRCALLGLLPGCGDAPALSELTKALNDKDAGVQPAAVRALADWPDAAAWDALAGFCGRAASESLRGVAFGGLVRIAGEENARPDAKLVDRYRQLFSLARTDAERRLVLGALAGAGHPGALQLAQGQLTNTAVRAEAEIAVKRIVEAIKARYPRMALEALQRLESKP